jgi:hypothetical protein
VSKRKLDVGRVTALCAELTDALQDPIADDIDPEEAARLQRTLVLLTRDVAMVPPLLYVHIRRGNGR